MSWPPFGRLVLVEWIDSNGSGGWRSHEEMLAHVTGQSLLCKTAGWIILDAPDRLSVVSSIAQTGSVDDATTIPRCAVVSVTELTWGGGEAGGPQSSRPAGMPP